MSRPILKSNIPSSILVVDDEENARLGLRLLLQAEGYSVRTAEHGHEAIGLIREQPSDLVLTDVHMPRMDGFDFLRVLRRDFPHVHVIMMTSAIGEQITSDAHVGGAVACLRKPVCMVELRSIIGRLCGFPMEKN